MIDLDALEEAAKIAEARRGVGAAWYSAVDLYLAGNLEPGDVPLIAAANPAAILGLVAALRDVTEQRDDVADRLSKYLDDSTGGQLSKPWYPVSVMIEVTKAHYAELAEEDHKDSYPHEAAHREALAKIEAVEALHTGLFMLFSWDTGTTYVEPCPECGTKPTGHAEECSTPGDGALVCKECSMPGLTIPYPCATVRALTEGETSE